MLLDARFTRVEVGVGQLVGDVGEDVFVFSLFTYIQSSHELNFSFHA